MYGNFELAYGYEPKWITQDDNFLTEQEKELNEYFAEAFANGEYDE